MFDNRHIFNGRINGQSVHDFTLDYSFDNLDKRLDYLINILDAIKDDSGRNFFEAYFDNYYKVIASMDDNLSENNNICKRLELMADYLLRSTEVRLARKNEETKYRFYVNKEEFLKRTNLEVSSDLVQYMGNGSQYMAFLLPKAKKAAKKEKIQKILPKDLDRDDYLGDVLRDYQTFLDLINDNVAKGNMRKRRASAIKGKVNDDMLKSKDMLLGVFGYLLRNPLAESTCPDWDRFDYTNIDHIKIALNMDRDLDPNDDLSHIILDLKIAIKELVKAKKLTNRQIEILTLYRQGLGFTEIGKILNTSNVNIYKTIKTISKKITKYYQNKK